MDYRISIEELENEFEIQEMARNLIREAFEDFEKESPLTTKPKRILLHCQNSLGKIEEQTELPF
jgi:hypothetical protein